MDRGQEATGSAIEGEPSVLPGRALAQTCEPLHVAPDRAGIRLVCFRQVVRLSGVLLRQLKSLDSTLMSIRRRNARYQILFNTTSNALSLWAAGEVFFRIAGTGPLVNLTSPPGPTLMLPLACLAGLYFLLNSGLVATAVAWQKGGSAPAIWREHFAVVSLNYFGAASASFFLIVLTRSVTPVAVGAVLPLLVVLYLAMRSWLGRLDDAQSYLHRHSGISGRVLVIQARQGAAPGERR